MSIKGKDALEMLHVRFEDLSLECFPIGDKSFYQVGYKPYKIFTIGSDIEQAITRLKYVIQFCIDTWSKYPEMAVYNPRHKFASRTNDDGDTIH